ncbi:hypothetical protein C9994_03600 [Marivirga lumbricoides]|uniref:Uncharacterized protein n=1 Tax=Marivirga lumbricoides TaxID=1046115 RepID=A0A2T4DTZ2_9BACT|nr:hypothetical protein C9994_03600 [Marivirga lumbricoides]
MNKTIFYFEKPSKWDLVTILLYIALTAFIYLTNIPSKVDWLFGYSFGTHLFLYFFNYKSLRKLNIWLIWIIFSLIHIYLYREYVDISSLQMFRGPAAHGLQFTWLLLILFQVLRLLSIKIQNRELVAPAKSRTDIWDNRKVTLVDFILFVIYFTIMLSLDLITMPNTM